MVMMFNKIKAFKVVFNEPDKVYSGGEKVTGRVVVEVCEVTRVKAVRVLACGVAKVLWMQGSQQCKQNLEYLRHEDTLLLEDQPTGEGPRRGKPIWEETGMESGAGVPCLIRLSALSFGLCRFSFNLQHTRPRKRVICT